MCAQWMCIYVCSMDVHICVLNGCAYMCAQWMCIYVCSMDVHICVLNGCAYMCAQWMCIYVCSMDVHICVLNGCAYMCAQWMCISVHVSCAVCRLGLFTLTTTTRVTCALGQSSMCGDARPLYVIVTSSQRISIGRNMA